MPGNATKMKLMETARELFSAKGVDRVGVREIAAKAGVNLSLMNYYFQSKENLLEQIFDFSIRENGHKLRQILSSNLPLEEKIRQYVYTYTDILIEDPLIVPFVLSTIHRKAEKSPYLKSIHTLYSTENFAKQLKAEADNGNIRPIDAEQFFVSMISLIIFPFAVEPLVKYRMNLSNDQMKTFLAARKEHVFDMLMATIKK